MMNSIISSKDEKGGKVAEPEDEIKSLIIRNLEADILIKDSIVQHREEDLLLRQEKRKFGFKVAIFACSIPFLILIWVSIILIDVNSMNPIDIKIVVIIAIPVFCFIIIYGILLRSMFALPPKEDNESNLPIAETLKIIKNLRNGG